MMRKLAFSLLAALALYLAPTPADAQIARPLGWQLPQTTLPSEYSGMPVSIWAWDTGVVGAYVGVFEKHTDGSWYGCRSNPNPDSDFYAKVSQMGAAPYLASIVPALNAALAACYPPIGSSPTPTPLPPGASAVDSVNYLLQGYHFVTVNGVVTLVHN